MEKLLSTYDAISLDEMKAVQLMNRIDTKYITTIPVLHSILHEAKDSYFVQRIDGQCLMPYYTLYYDTFESDMYKEHLRGRKKRQKIRIRSYEASNQSFLEVKNKNHKGRTEKIRIPYIQEDDGAFNRFIESYAHYPLHRLKEQMENRFSRITLVSRNLTERLTIDVNLRFHNLSTEQTCLMDNLVVIELKRDGKVHSPILDVLKRMHIHPAKFSKYCMGRIYTDNELKSNRFKPRLRRVEKLCSLLKGIHF